MILDQYLNESYNPYVGVVEPLFESYITGENPNEVNMITEEFDRQCEKLDEGVLLAESLAMICETKGNYASAIQLQENAVTDFFKKIKEYIQKLWQKIKAFFSNLFKSIAVSMGDVNKALSGIDKYLNKDFSDFEYQGHKWNSSPKIADTLGKKAKELVNSRKILIEGCKDVAKLHSDSNTKVKEFEKVPDDHGSGLKEAIATMVGESGELTLEQAKDKIKEAWGCEKSAESIKDFSAISKENMISFLKEFNKNKVLKDLQKETDSALKELTTTINVAQKEAEDLQSSAGENAEGADKTSIQTSVKNLISAIKTLSTECTQIVSSYDKLMSECIACEKAKFSEYRSAISAAVRYKPKEK